MNSMQRVMKAISHEEADRVPVFHLLSSYGAKEMEISIEEYFSKAENVVDCQLKMQRKYSSDCLYTFYYAATEIEAFGGNVIFRDKTPPNAAEPFIKSIEGIKNIEIPKIEESKSLEKILKTTRMLKQSVGDEIPIIGVVMSPFSLPIMQMGFENYLKLLYFHENEFNQLMKLNEEFCVKWANTQLQAGATAICYFDPMASPTIIEREKYLKTGHVIAQRVSKRVNGPLAIHLASGITLPVVDDIVDCKAAVLGFSNKDNLDKIKDKSKNKICLLGNLNGVDMINWNAKKAREEVKYLIKKLAIGGGFILSDNHGEIPYQVDESILLEISNCVKKFGRYPIEME